MVMKIIPKNNLAAIKFPLPIYKAVHMADAISRDGEEFKIFVGLDEGLVEQLKKYSADQSDTELQENTSDYKRFVTGAYEDWHKKNRTSFALVHAPTGALAALVRFGPEPLHEGCKCHTAAWRAYQPFRGKGLVKDFAKFCFEIYRHKFPDFKYFWITVKKANTGSLRLAESLGFQKTEKYPTSPDRQILLLGS